jgi:hypothetical protein
MQGETFGFEHEQAHRFSWGSMSPLTRYSVMPYILYPHPSNQADWHQDHQQAHDDMQQTLPGTFGGIGFLDLILGIIPPGFIFPDIPVAQTGTISQQHPYFNVQDYDLTIWAQREWWTFQNHYAHLDSQSSQNSATFVFPFF